MHRGLWNKDHASFFSEATLIEIGVYINMNFTIYSSHYIDQSIKSVILCDNEDKTE